MSRLAHQIRAIVRGRLVRPIASLLEAYAIEFGPEAVWVDFGAWLFAGAAFWLFALLAYAVVGDGR